MNPVPIFVTLRYYVHICVLGCASGISWLVQRTPRLARARLSKQQP